MIATFLSSGIRFSHPVDFPVSGFLSSIRTQVYHNLEVFFFCSIGLLCVEKHNSSHVKGSQHSLIVIHQQMHDLFVHILTIH